MKVIELKCENPHFVHMYNGAKLCEVREIRDRKFEKGCYLLLREYNAESDYYSGHSMLVHVTHILTDARYVKKGYCIMSVKVIIYD